MKKLNENERYCPLFKGKCLENKCAWFTGQADSNGQLMCGECAVRALGFVDYTLQTLADIIDNSKSSTKKGKRK